MLMKLKIKIKSIKASTVTENVDISKVSISPLVRSSLNCPSVRARVRPRACVSTETSASGGSSGASHISAAGI